MNDKRRMKVLLSAYSCEPGLTSEPGVGWNWALQLSTYHDVWVLTRQSNRSAIDAELEKKNIRGLQFVYYDLPKWMRFWKKGERGLYLYYTLWQLLSMAVARRLHRQFRFDLAHYITFGSVMLPSFLFLMPTKLILGPIGGGGKAPLSFLGEFSLRGKIESVVRHCVQFFLRFNPFLLMLFVKADKILLRDKETLKIIPKTMRRKCIFFLETGVPPELIQYGKRKRKEKELIISVVGRLLYSKISRLTLKILVEFKRKYRKPFKVYIIGNGREKKTLVEYCNHSSIQKNVIFTGRIPRGEVFNFLSDSDIYISTSFKEGGSWALFEAITLELPIVCLKAGGPDILVCDDCGFKVDIRNPRQVIEDFSDALIKLAENPDLRFQMAQRAKAHLLGSYTWEEMGHRMNRIYEEVVS